MYMRSAEKLESRMTILAVVITLVFLTGDPPTQEPEGSPPIDTSTWQEQSMPCTGGGMMLTSYPPICLEAGTP